MKTWTLVWFLVFPANDSGKVEWELHKAENITRQECFVQLAAKDAEFKEQAMDGIIAGHEIYCKGPEPQGPVGRVVLEPLELQAISFRQR